MAVHLAVHAIVLDAATRHSCRCREVAWTEEVRNWTQEEGIQLRYNYLMACIGITKEHSGAVAHGLRAQFAGMRR